MAGSAARCTSISIGATAVENPVSVAIVRDDELIKKVYSDTNVGRYYVGERNEGVRVRFADVAAYKLYKKGDYIAALTATVDGANEIDTTDSDAAADVVSISLTHGIVTEAVEFESTNGEPVEYSLTVMCAKVGANEGTLTLT